MGLLGGDHVGGGKCFGKAATTGALNTSFGDEGGGAGGKDVIGRLWGKGNVVLRG